MERKNEKIFHVDECLRSMIKLEATTVKRKDLFEQNLQGKGMA